MRGRTEPPGGWGWKLQPRQGTPGSGLWVEKEGKLRGWEGGEGAGVKRWASEGWKRTGEKRACPLSPFSPQVSVLHSVNRVAHPSHMLSSQQFLHRGHQQPPEMAGHSLASSHRNSST